MMRNGNPYRRGELGGMGGLFEYPTKKHYYYYTTDADRSIGYDPDEVFKVIHLDGIPTIRVSGKTFGAIHTKETYCDFIFRWNSNRVKKNGPQGKISGEIRFIVWSLWRSRSSK